MAAGAGADAVDCGLCDVLRVVYWLVVVYATDL